MKHRIVTGRPFVDVQIRAATHHGPMQNGPCVSTPSAVYTRAEQPECYQYRRRGKAKCLAVERSVARRTSMPCDRFGPRDADAAAVQRVWPLCPR
jgi:hypothetical protein